MYILIGLATGFFTGTFGIGGGSVRQEKLVHILEVKHP